MLAVIRTRNGELCNELIQKNGDLKSVRVTAKAFEMANQGSKTMAGDDCTARGGDQQSSKDSHEMNKITRPRRYSMRNNRSDHSSGRPTTKAAENMGLIEYHTEQTTQAPAQVMEVERQEIHTPISEYEDVFTSIGKLKGVTIKLHVVPKAPGAIQKQRRISIPLKEKFDKILDRWHALDIIEDVGDKPTNWCSNVVLTPKKDGESLRASLDMTDVNKYIKRARHTKPTLRELETRLNGAKLFSHLDMNDGYMQLELAEESRKLTTFYTHCGLKRFKGLYFGVNSAAEIFNEEVRKVVSLEPNAISIYDDILLFGATLEEQERVVRHILQLWQSHRLTLNMKKSRFNPHTVTIFGKVFSSEEVSPRGFDYKLNYAPGKKAKAEMNEADYKSRHPEPLTMLDPRAVHQAKFTVRENKDMFEKDIRAVVQAALPNMVSWDELLEGTSQDLELKDLKSVIARGYFAVSEQQAEPKEHWKEVAIDFWGTISTSEYLLLVICKHSYDNGTPFNGQEFRNFSTYLGFTHEHKTPKNPQANDEAEQFMQVGDSVLVKQDLSSKASLPYEGEPLEVQHRKGTQMVAKRRDGSTITRSAADFKKVPYHTLDEVGRSQLEPGFGRKPSEEPQVEELPKPQERLEEVLSPGEGLSYTPDRVKPTTENVEEAPSSVGATAHTERPRRSNDKYLSSKYPDHKIPDRIL
ncbi:Uncharacterized protein K02A2.6 [Stylophora pistillata]|uniref:Uncharacterized protein K02A2.6 n=1 Tax=Stylophora pistillata TaxID=50429 RepID=A0A2B4SCR3_STYPI|nr:Uncharacterized protein K02A2.6 [Stylophora pistillata]